ncbi:hypothetical protein EVAR_75833_1 [Eumeta japonica]|uniref:Uncharacterized protein n=1 Tax=Eumeta variegata TaxID=151549 RepID=A0A4C1TD42_EUMVA|nr:hypothetical protein EVAR_75833_1 [Eumeta japonica]
MVGGKREGRRVNPARISAVHGTKIAARVYGYTPAARRVNVRAADVVRRGPAPPPPPPLHAAGKPTPECPQSRRRSPICGGARCEIEAAARETNSRHYSKTSEDATKKSVVRFSWLTSGQIVMKIIWSPSTSCS